MATGSTDDTSDTNSISPLGHGVDDPRRARRRTDSSVFATMRGVKPRFTMDRSFVCFGGSVEIIDRIPESSVSSGSAEPNAERG